MAKMCVFRKSMDAYDFRIESIKFHRSSARCCHLVESRHEAQIIASPKRFFRWLIKPTFASSFTRMKRYHPTSWNDEFAVTKPPHATALLIKRVQQPKWRAKHINWYQFVDEVIYCDYLLSCRLRGLFMLSILLCSVASWVWQFCFFFYFCLFQFLKILQLKCEHRVNTFNRNVFLIHNRYYCDHIHRLLRAQEIRITPTKKILIKITLKTTTSHSFQQFFLLCFNIFRWNCQNHWKISESQGFNFQTVNDSIK